MFAISGAARKHSAIASNVGRNLGNMLPKGCRTFDSDLKVYVETVNKGFHPDVSVACRPITGPDEINAIDNPVLLVEVISEGSANYDPVSTAGGQKFWYYSQLPSLREYVLIEQDRQAVEVRYRSSATADWVMAYYEGEGVQVVLRSFDLRLPIAQIYEDTDGL
ncbi:MAG: Uma2 family endonuclease [Tunicatimonas sp.]